MQEIIKLIFEHVTGIIIVTIVSIIAIVLTMILKYTKANAENLFHPLQKGTLKRDMESSVKIRDYCNQGLIEMKADRFQVHLFHNGEYYLVGNHIMKFSCIQEAAKDKTTRTGDKIQSRLISRFIDGIGQIVTSDGIVRIRWNDKNMTDDYHNLMIACDSKLHLAKRLMHNGNTVGFILAIYTNNIRKGKCVKETKKECGSRCSCLLNKYVAKIESEMSSNIKNKKINIWKRIG